MCRYLIAIVRVQFFVNIFFAQRPYILWLYVLYT